MFRLASAVMVAATLGTAVHAQLASRPVGEWQRLLDSPERIAALRIDDVVARLALKPADVVADLGTGTGPFVVAFAKAVPSGAVYAVEIDKDFLPLTCARSPGISSRGHASRSSITTRSGAPTPTSPRWWSRKTRRASCLRRSG